MMYIHPTCNNAARRTINSATVAPSYKVRTHVRQDSRVTLIAASLQVSVYTICAVADVWSLITLARAFASF